MLQNQNLPEVLQIFSDHCNLPLSHQLYCSRARKDSFSFNCDSYFHYRHVLAPCVISFMCNAFTLPFQGLTHHPAVHHCSEEYIQWSGSVGRALDFCAWVVGSGWTTSKGLKITGEIMLAVSLIHCKEFMESPPWSDLLNTRRRKPVSW